MKIKKLLILAVPALIAVYGVTYVSNMSSQSSKPAPAVVEEIAIETEEVEVTEPYPLEDGMEGTEEDLQEPQINFYDHPTRIYASELQASVHGERDGMQMTIIQETVRTIGPRIHSQIASLEFEVTYRFDARDGGYFEFATSEARDAARDVLMQPGIVIAQSLEAEARRRLMNCTDNFCFGSTEVTPRPAN